MTKIQNLFRTLSSVMKPSRAWVSGVRFQVCSLVFTPCMKLYFKSWSWFYPGPLYILPVLLRNAKPNNGRFQNRAPKVSVSIKLTAFQTGGWADT